MRLLTHNFLQSNVRGTVDGYPLKIEGINIVIEKSSMDVDLVSKVLPKLNYPAFVGAINDLRSSAQNLISDTMFAEAPDIPSECPQEGQDTTECTMKALHFFLFDIHVIEGFLVCPDTGRRFPIKDGIPNMILHEDEKELIISKRNLLQEDKELSVCPEKCSTCSLQYKQGSYIL